MSKSNRIKGKWNDLMGCRVASVERVHELESRTKGVPESRKSVQRGFKITKTQRKSAKRLLDAGDNKQHPLSRSASIKERGYAKIMSLVTQVFTTPEGNLYDKSTS